MPIIRSGPATYSASTPGGGGYGDALRRDPERVLADVREGFVSPEAAEREFGVALARAGEAWIIDRAATDAIRTKIP
jgi:N-methylhydantoinase B